MGYVRRKTYLLTFEQEEYAGLEIRLRPIRVGEVIDASDDRDVKDMILMFAKALVSWNLEYDDGTPVPTTLDGVRSCDIGMIMDAYTAWQRQMSGEISGPKEENSISGSPLAEVSLPMEPLSESLVS
jgi:hypothetical protein